MVLRFSIFFSLLALFYYYCKNDSSDHLRQPNDINRIEVPEELSPAFYNNDYSGNSMRIDSAISISFSMEEPKFISSISQKY